MATVGKKVIKLNFVVGFCAQFATAISVIIGSMLGLPLSTTHCMVGSLLGIVVAKKLPFVNFAYVDHDQRDEVTKWIADNTQPAEFKEVPADAEKDTANLALL